MKKVNRILAGAVALVLAAGTGVFPLPASATPDNYQSSREAAAQGMVLLKNEGAALPLPEGNKVALFGMNQVDYVDGGGGAATVNAEYKVSLLQGMQAKEKEGKVQLYQPLVDAYLQADKNDQNPKGRKAQIPLTSGLLNGARDFADTAIISIGRFTEEGTDMEAVPGGYYLSAAEQDMVNKVCAAGFSRVVVVLNVATAVDTTWFKDNNHIHGALMAWLGGMEGGNAMADILCGDVNPSGKLPDTLVKSFDDYASSDFHESTAYVNYTEDIYVGYRYFETIPGAPDKVNYEFGYGLSYTTFALSNQKVSRDKDDIKISVTVKNTGGRSGREVVQAYYSAPQGVLGKPSRELACFAKTRELKPGESQTLTMSFAIQDMASYDDSGKTGRKSAYVLEPGDYSFYVGTSVRSCEKSSYVYTLDSLQVIEQLSEKLASKRLEKRLLADGSYEKLEVNLPDTACQVKASGVTKLECENYTDAERNIAIETPAEGTCVGYFNQGRYVSYDLTVEQAGTYYVTLHAANGHGLLSNFLNVYLDGKKQAVSLDMEQTGFDGSSNRWFVFKDCTPFALTLPKGKVQLKLECNVGQGPNLDYLLFQKDTPAKTTFSIVGGSRLKAAEAYAQKSGEVRPEACGDEGGGLSLGYCEPGEWLTYKVNVKQSGAYDLRARIASERDTGAFQVLMDDQVIADFPAQPSTGGWQTWKTTGPARVSLTAGEHEMKILFTGSVLNLNWLEFQKVEEAANAASVFRRAAAALSGETILLADVYENPKLMDAFLDQMTLEELAGIAGGQPGGDTGGIGNIRRLGVTTAGTADGPLGLHLNTISYKATSWPCAILLASTFDVELIEEIAGKIGMEAQETNIDILLGPSMNIHRNPLCGRNFEYYSEDPLLTGKIAAAFIKGLQAKGIGATVKHFALNNKENNRRTCDSRVTERAAREIYLRGFQMVAEEASPWAMMSAYNPINGVKASANQELLTDILREEWGYDGLVMSDWDTGANHSLEALAGGDVKMPTGSPSELVTAVNDPDIPLTRELLEQRAKNILNLVMKSRSFYNRLHPTSNEIAGQTRLKAAELFFDKSDGVRAEACGDEDGGRSLGYCEPGEWLTYKVNVKQSGAYDLRARIASEKDTGAFQVLMDDQVIADFPAQPSTGGWQTWKTTGPARVSLTAGEHEMKILFTGSVLNLNWLEFQKHQEGGDASSTPSEPGTSSKPDTPSTPDESSSKPGVPSNPDASSQPGTPTESSKPDAPDESGSSTQNPDGGTGSTGGSGNNTNASGNPATGAIPAAAILLTAALAGGAAAVVYAASCKRGKLQ